MKKLVKFVKLVNAINSNEAIFEMAYKFVEIKKGNIEAIDSLINNLQGLKAIYKCIGIDNNG